MTTAVLVRAALGLALALAAAVPVRAQMPDPSAMSGMAIPSADMPDGAVSVRVVRGAMTNNLEGVPVELHGAGAVRRATTGADGRAHFEAVPAGSRVHALATVDGVRMETREFEVPARGGVRALLVARASGAPGGGGTESGAAPAGETAPVGPPVSAGAAGDLVLGGNTRIVFEFQQDVLQVFYLLEIVNRTSAPISPDSALIFDLPTGAAGATVLEGSTKQANAKGPRVTVTGPFAPGATPLQIAFSLDTFSSEIDVTQRFPLPMDMVAIAVERVGDLKVSSPQVARTQETPIENSVFVMGTGPALEAGSPLTIVLAGVPHHSRMPLYVALGLALALFGWAAWVVLSPSRVDAQGARRSTLEARRERGLAQLAALEAEHAQGRTDERRYAARRAALVAELERIYGELDTGAVKPGDRGAAA